MANAVIRKNSVEVKSNNQNTVTSEQSEEIAKLAYQYFLERGGEHGHDLEDWQKAEAVIRSGKKK